MRCSRGKQVKRKPSGKKYRNLVAYRVERFRDRPSDYSPERRVLEDTDRDNFRARQWRRICERGDLGDRAMKDLRNTFASQLLTCGVQLGYVSRQLGHSKPTVTADHYAKWCGGDDYRDPLTPRDGELPADLLARIPAESPSYFRHSGGSTRMGVGFTNEKPSGIAGLAGADERIRTADLRITNALLYQLSYVGMACHGWSGGGSLARNPRSIPGRAGFRLPDRQRGLP